MCRLIFDTDALRGTSFEVQLASYSQSVPSDHKIQILHAMQVSAGQEETAEGIDQQHQHQVDYDVSRRARR